MKEGDETREGGPGADDKGESGKRFLRKVRRRPGQRRKKPLKKRPGRGEEDSEAWRREWFKRMISQRRRNLAMVITIVFALVAVPLLDVAVREGDPDGDGLSNAEEKELGTDPRKADTDGDGLDDKEEIDLGLDPLDKDMDGDGLSDGEEVRTGEDGFQTDPEDRDTDGDGLDDWEEVNEGEDGYITYPTDRDTDGDGMEDGWESGHGLDPLGSADSTLDGDNDGYFLYVLDDRTGYHLEYHPFTSFMEYRNGTDPTDPDTDGDGLRDGWEAHFQLEPLDPDDAGGDADADGLSAPQEMAFFTDPKNDDTDGDGLKDGVEHGLGLNGTSWDTDSDGLPDGWENIYGGVGVDWMDPAREDSDGDGVPDPDEDEDYDGLSNVLEYYKDTNPLDDDSDDDGMPDGWEFDMGLDPLKDDGTGDADGDNLTNYREFTLGTHAGEPDTDGDGLTDDQEAGGFPGVLRKGVFSDAVGPGIRFYSTDPLSNDTDGDDIPDDEDGDGRWGPGEEVIDGADNDGDGLIDEEWDLNDFNEIFGWFGLLATRTNASSNDTDGDGLLDNVEVPSTVKDLQDLPVLQAFTSPRLADTDGDGLDDPAELEGTAGTVTDPLDDDMDGDGLLDGEELLEHMTDPYKLDTEGDGMDDGWEVVCGLDPLRDDSEEDPDHDGVYVYTGSRDIKGDGTWLYEEYDDEHWDYVPFKNIEEYHLYTVEGAAGKPVANRCDPNNTDTDGDGMSDGWEYAVHEDGNPHPLVPDGHRDPDNDLVRYRASNLTDSTQGENYVHKFTNLEEYSFGVDLDGDGLVDYSPFDPNNNFSISGNYPNDGTVLWDTDHDGDGLDTGWELLFGGWLTLQDTDHPAPDAPEPGSVDQLDPFDPEHPGESDGDPDGDGCTNLEEFRAGDPWIYPDNPHNTTTPTAHGAYDPYDGGDCPPSARGTSGGAGVGGEPPPASPAPSPETPLPQQAGVNPSSPGPRARDSEEADLPSPPA